MLMIYLNDTLRGGIGYFFNDFSCCDSVDNNMVEVFNAYILFIRHKPIITMLEDVRDAIQQ